ncbi:hypothetical protein [Desulfotignum balticum]|uniref:hypothetical protein n=1 Tax=Desulfotignum balticum TaxID=115781 RepID=UPI0012EBCFFB|nr:hypothetical protein [Desulfotignum balticum]
MKHHLKYLGDLSRGFAVAQMAEKHGGQGPMVWPLSSQDEKSIGDFDRSDRPTVQNAFQK